MSQIFLVFDIIIMPNAYNFQTVKYNKNVCHMHEFNIFLALNRENDIW